MESRDEVRGERQTSEGLNRSVQLHWVLCISGMWFWTLLFCMSTGIRFEENGHQRNRAMMNIPNSGTDVKWMEHDGKTQNFLSLFLAFLPYILRLVHGAVSECIHGFSNKENLFYPKWREDDFLWKSVRGMVCNTLEEKGSLSGHYSHAFAVSFL